MTLSPQDAAAALQDIEQAGARSQRLRQYQGAAPHFFLWAAVWLVGYGVTALGAQYASVAWPVLIALGWLGSAVTSRVMSRRVDLARMKAFWSKFWGLAGITMGFAVAVLTVMQPDARQVAAFFPLLVGAIYAGVGLWVGPRFLITGIAVGVLTMIGFFALRTGFFALRADFALWMAVVGSGALALAGLWLRRA